MLLQTQSLGLAEERMETIARRWGMFLVRGIAATLFGLLTLWSPGASLVALVLLFGAYALVDGALTLAVTGFGPRPQRWGWLVFQGLMGIAGGIVTLSWPHIGAMALLWVIAAWALFTGLGAVATAIRIRRQVRGEWVLALAGLLAMAFGLLLLLFPGAGALAVVLWIGAYALVNGAVMVGFAFRLRSWGEHHPGVPAVPVSAPA
jgi:uncharacterized membrane protein HdeD (DUF308 family)